MPYVSNVEYTAIDSVSEKEEHDNLLGDLSGEIKSSRLIPRLQRLVPWALAMFFACTSIFLLLERKRSPFGTYESGYSTDIILPETIPLEQIRFRGSPRFFPNGTGWLEPVDETAPWPRNMVLFGPPSKEIDHNWQRLIGSRYFSISESEAQRAWGTERHRYVDQRKGGYSAGLEVFHTLHCVNALRKALHNDYYHHTSSHGPFHLEHCLDALRQTIQCYGSTTLIPTEYRDGIQHNYIDSDQMHTCRSFSYLRDFVTARGHKGDAYVARNMDLVDTQKHDTAVAWKKQKNSHKHKEKGQI
ncbi:hypothetical protein F5Y16DRAFT_403593 [Xylariaceae sp. FL0255]|nr:hypothetical protein F5Y16DRAFT_403593 [Xylariaceae sp. FL0255]